MEETFFDRKVNEQLMRAQLQRRAGSQKLYLENEWIQFVLPVGVKVASDRFLVVEKFKEAYGLLDEPDGLAPQRKLPDIQKVYVALQPLLDKFSGRLVLAGGCFKDEYTPKDLDFFFINCNLIEMDSIIAQAVTIIREMHSARHQEVIDNDLSEEELLQIVSGVKRKELVHNVAVLVNGVWDEIPTNDKKVTYQFIMRSYSSIADLLWSFDMYGAMIAYDGKNMMATDVGAWAYVNHCNVVDISWLSPYFRLRFYKYCVTKNYKMVIPGSLPKGVVDHRLREYKSFVVPKNKGSMNVSEQEICWGLYYYKIISVTGDETRWVKIKLSDEEELLREHVCKEVNVRFYPESNEKVLASEFYHPDQHPHQLRFFSPEVDLLILMANRFDRGSLFYLLPRDVMMLIMQWVIFN